MSQSFTTKYNGISNVLVSDVSIFPGFDPSATKTPPKGEKFKAIWDTGATGSAISSNVVKKCGLKPISMRKVRTAGGVVNSPVYFINIVLPNGVGITRVHVTEVPLAGGEDVLIGMDVIGLGDFAVSNFNGETMFSFRYPSSKHTDYVAIHNANSAKKNSRGGSKRKRPKRRKQFGKNKK